MRYVLIGIGLSATAFVASREAEANRVQSAFLDDAHYSITAFDITVDRNLETVQAVAALFTSADAVSREDFATFTSGFLERHSSLNSISWIPAISSGEREAFERSIRDEGFPEFSIMDRFESGVIPAGVREEYFPITLSEPLGNQRSILGLDAMSVPGAETIFNRARDAGEPRSSGGILSISTDALSIFFVSPVYSKATTSETIAQRRANLTGFVLGVIEPTHLVSESAQTHDTVGSSFRVGLGILDVTAPARDQILIAAPERPKNAPDTLFIQDLLIQDRVWEITAVPLVSYESTWQSFRSWLYLIVGLIVTALFTAYVAMINRRSAATEKLYLEVIESKSLYSAIVEQMHAGVTIYTDTRRLFVNERYAAINGFSDRKEALTTPSYQYTADHGSTGGWAPEQGESNNFLYDMKLPNGEIKVLAGAVTAITYDGQPAWLSVSRDITEARERLDLIQSELRFRNLFDAAPIGSATLDSHRKVIDSNPALATMLGVTNENLVGADLRSFTAGRVAAINGFQRLVAGETDFLALEVELKTTGAARWVHYTTAAVRNGAGRFLYAIRMVEDITKRKRAEIEIRDQGSGIRDQKEKYEVIVENANDGISIFTGRKRLYVNQAFANLHGYANLQAANNAEVIGETLNRGTMAYAHRRLSDGAPLSVSVSYTPITYLEQPAVLAITRDTTKEDSSKRELAKANAQLHREAEERGNAEVNAVAGEARLRSILNTTVDGIITIDERRLIESFNPAAETIFGYTATEVIGSNVSMLMPEPYHSEHDSYVGNYLHTGEAKIIGAGREVEGLRKDGSTFPLDLAVSEATGGPRRIFTGIVRDISERKEIERMKSEFLGMVSHELRTPLTSIRGAVGLAISGSLGELPPQAQRMLNIASNNTERLMRLINDILDLERMNGGRAELTYQSCNAEMLIRQAMQAVASMVAEGKVAIDVTPSMVTFDADPDRIIQTLTNLLANAVKFSPEGTSISVKAAIEDSSVRFDVIDKGRGIPTEKLDRIFDRFEQVDSSDSRVHGGTGLGLTISQRIVNQHGGRIWVASELGKGTTFSFVLPLSQMAAANVDQ